MINAGTIGMPLHFGKVPGFLTQRMGQMGDAIVESIVDNYGKSLSTIFIIFIIFVIIGLLPILWGGYQEIRSKIKLIR